MMETLASSETLEVSEVIEVYESLNSASQREVEA